MFLKHTYFVVFFLIVITNSIFALKVYKALLPNETLWAQSGLHFIKGTEKFNASHSLTFCVRFKFKELNWSARLWEIKVPDEVLSFMWMSPRYPATYFFFGSEGGNWILKDLENETFILWHPYRWHHMCFGFEQDTGYVILAKVSAKL